MSTRTGIVVTVVALALLLVLAWRYQRTLELGLPAREVCADAADARLRAEQWSRTNGYAMTPVRGTGSMAPFIPAAPAGSDPYATMMAYAAIDTRRTWASVQAGELCVYRSPQGPIMHSAAARRGAAWVMAGLHNRESDYYMRESDLIGVVARVFVWQ